MASFLKRLTHPEPNSVMLNHFRRLQISDSWDGQTTCADGWTRNVLVYQDRVVSFSAVLKADGSSESRSRTADPFWESMAGVAEAYMKILCIARNKYFRGNDSPFMPRTKEVAELRQREPATWDTVYMSQKVLEVLNGHPQYLQLVKDFDLVLVPVEQDRWRVEVKKFATDAA